MIAAVELYHENILDMYSFWNDQSTDETYKDHDSSQKRNVHSEIGFIVSSQQQWHAEYT